MTTALAIATATTTNCTLPSAAASQVLIAENSSIEYVIGPSMQSLITKKPCKPRKDNGVARGPNKCGKQCSRVNNETLVPSST